MATFAQIKATAHRAGYTRRVIVEVGDTDLYGFIRPATDFEGTFTMIDDDDGAVLKVSGWLANVRDLDD